MNHINEIKDQIQRQAHAIWRGGSGRGTIEAGTGFGKSRLFILEVKRLWDEGLLNEQKVLLVVPTVKLRDDNWPREFADWDLSWLWENHVRAICFASLKNEKGNHYPFVGLDEMHHLTTLAASAFSSDEEDIFTAFFTENLCDSVMGLTATAPTKEDEPIKYRIMQQVAPTVFTYSLEDAIRDGLIADYQIRCIMTLLDDSDKYIPAGNKKKKSWMQTEKKTYEYMTSSLLKARIAVRTEKDPVKAAKLEEWADVSQYKLNRFLLTLKSKTNLAKRCIQMLHEHQTGRGLIFFGGIDQCNEVMGEDVFHSKSTSAAYDAFNREEISMLGVVDAANEGINFVKLDWELILAVGEKKRKMIQRIGRALRLREEDPTFKAIIYVLCIEDSLEKKWMDNSLSIFDPAKIHYYSHLDVPK